MAIGIICGLGAGFFWGLSFLVPMLLGDFRSVQVAFGRFFFFGLISVFVLAAKRERLRRILSRKTLGMALLMSLTGYSAYYLILTEAIRRSGITVSSLIIGLLPLTIALAGRSRPQAVGQFRLSLALIASGILLLNLGGLSGADFSPSGVGLSLVSLLMWTFFAVQNARFLKSHPEIDNTTWTNLLGVFSMLSMAVFLWMEPTPAPGTPALWDAPNLTQYAVWTAILGFGSTWIATLLWNVASVRLPTSLTGQLIVSETVFALLFGYLHSWTLPTARETAAVALLLAGVMLGIRAFSKTSH